MFKKLRNLPDNVKNILAIVLSIVIIMVVVISLTFLNTFLKQNFFKIKDIFG